MPANTDPIFSKNGKVGSILVTAANTSSAGGGTIATDIFLAFTADATNGSFIRSLEWIPVATTPTSMTATVLRVFISSVTSGATTSSNTYLYREVTAAAIAADNASTGIVPYIIPFGFAIPASYTILVTNHAAPAANTNWRATVFAGDY